MLHLQYFSEDVDALDFTPSHDSSFHVVPPPTGPCAQPVHRFHEATLEVTGAVVASLDFGLTLLRLGVNYTL